MAKQNVHRFEIKLFLNDPEEYELYRILSNKPEKYSTNKQFYLDIIKAGIHSIGSNDETDNLVLQAAKEEARKAAIEETRKILEPIFGGLEILPVKEERKTSYESEDRLPSSRMTSIAEKWG